MALLIAALVFIALVSAIVGVWWALAPARSVQDRLARTATSLGLQTDIVRPQVSMGWVFGRLAALRERAGTKRTSSEILAAMLACVAVAGLIALLRMGGLFWALVAALAAAPLPLVYLAWCANRRLQQFQKEFPDALDMMTRSIRAGHALGGAIRLVGEEMGDPIGPEFMRISEEMRLGLETSEALGGLERRIPADDVRFFCTAMNIHRTTGGNLAEILERLTEVIRERYKLLSHARVLSTQHRWSAILVGISPVAFAVLFQLVNPAYFDAFWQSGAAPMLLTLGLLSEAIGFFMIWRISKIKV